MNKYLRKIISVITCAVLSALFIVLMFFCTPKIAAVPETTGDISYYVSTKQPDGTFKTETITYTVGKDVTAVRICDLGELNRITNVNYVADKFVTPNSLTYDFEIVDLTKPFKFAEKGTLIFVILNLDPLAENFDEQKEALDGYKMGEHWRFTFSLPKIFCASNIYLKANLIASNGEIEGYNFIDYNTSYVKQTDKLSTKTGKTVADLQFYTRREAIAPPLSAAQIITVHYQSTGSAYSGISECPLIGTESRVKNLTENSQNLLIAFAIIAAVVFAVFVVLSIIERSHEFISAIIWTFGIFIMLLSRFFISGITTVPLMWTAFSLAASFIILGGALLSIGRNFGKVPTQFIFPAFMVLGAILAFIRPFVPFGAASALNIVCIVVKAIGAALLTAFIGLETFRIKQEDNYGTLRTVCATLIDVAIIASLFLPQIFPAQYNSMLWMCVATTAATFINVFIMFFEMKKSNAYLTDNLHMEVARQVKDIKAIIDERDKLLQFISHDMRKPLASSVSLLETAIDREKDLEQIKTLQIIKQNDLRVVTNLSEIAVYAKYNYIAEASKVFDLSELCKSICLFHSFDCNANGIVLKNFVNKNYKVFAKRQGLESALSNIIMNAVEHSGCTAVILYVKSEKNKTVLCVADDGKGISPEMDVFKPYVSENKPETGGIGLYICKSIIESMNGELTYSSDANGTVFYISLLKA